MNLRKSLPWVATAVLAFGALAAQAQVLSSADEMAVKPGMTRDEVQQRLGQPIRRAQYSMANGSTWSYAVAGQSVAEETFDVDFGVDGRVKSAGEAIGMQGSHD